MAQTIKKILGMMIIVFSFISFLIGILMIWGFLDTKETLEIFLKLLYTFISFSFLSLIILLVMHFSSNNGK
ncbi:hypothetical protein HGA92_05335 [Candidatus Gracilibacteria bacterium]|nr:hypothetical protein [Candidatus Gracilibacteria bacterium]NUJ99055.1 hypothetical protein [Candidatus Gracilibacteria bacterium]